MDDVNELGKFMKKSRDKVRDALSRVSPEIPRIERARDVFDNVQPFYMKFRTEIDKERVLLDLNFDTMLTAATQDTCSDCYCSNVETFVGGQETYTLEYKPRQGSVKVYFGDYVIPVDIENPKYVVDYDTSIVTMKIPSDGYNVTIMYVYDYGNCAGAPDDDGNPCTYTVDEFNNRVIEAGAPDLGQATNGDFWGPIVLETDPATATKNFPVSKDTMIMLSPGGTKLGAGADPHLVIGYYSGYKFRTLLQFTLNWDNVVKIQSAYLYVKTTGQVHCAFSSDPDIYAERCTASWVENSGRGTACGGGGYSGDNTDYNFTSWTSTGKSAITDIATAENTWDTINITDIVEAWAPITVKKRDGTPGGAYTNYGLVLRIDDEWDGGVTEIYGQESSYDPYIKLTYLTQDTVPGTASVDNGIAAVSSTIEAYTGNLDFGNPSNMAISWPMIVWCRFKINLDYNDSSYAQYSEENGIKVTFRAYGSTPDKEVLYETLVGWNITSGFIGPTASPVIYWRYVNENGLEQTYVTGGYSRPSGLTIYKDTWYDVKLYIEPGNKLYTKVWKTTTAEPSTWKYTSFVTDTAIDINTHLPKSVELSYNLLPSVTSAERILTLEFIKFLCSYPVIAGTTITDSFDRYVTNGWGIADSNQVAWVTTNDAKGGAIYDHSVNTAVARMFVSDGGGSIYSKLPFTHSASFAVIHKFRISSNESFNTGTWYAHFQMGNGNYNIGGYYPRFWGFACNDTVNFGSGVYLYLGSKFYTWDTLNTDKAFDLQNNIWYYVQWEVFDNIIQRIRIWRDGDVPPEAWTLTDDLNGAGTLQSYGYRIEGHSSNVGDGELEIAIDDLNIEYDL